MFVKTQTTEERFWAKVDKSGDCWLWMGGLNPLRNAGTFWLDGGTRLAHRVVWELERSPIPAGAEIHHNCHNRRCVNPDHLELMASHSEHWIKTQWEGRGPVAENAAKTHCDHGHEFTAANTYVAPGGKRACRECQKVRWHASAKFKRRERLDRRKRKMEAFDA